MKLAEDTISHTNHCLIQKNLDVARERPPASRIARRIACAAPMRLLAKDGITIDDLMALTRDEVAICTRPKPPTHVESCGAAIMSPSSGDFWAVWGIPADTSMSVS